MTFTDWLDCHTCAPLTVLFDGFFFATGAYVGAAIMYLALKIRALKNRKFTRRELLRSLIHAHD